MIHYEIINMDAYKKVCDNKGFCATKKDKSFDSICICREFRNAPAESICRCGAYKKYEQYDRAANCLEPSHEECNKCGRCGRCFDERGLLRGLVE